ncbi:zinc finger C2HC domain-containing protein 1A-like isoform X2 [Mercenaria mercenaria]|uniref:zinc finger C2HC domain-containing protein 1A-like isoform X2 n=1 Tax=Mercenaria mercenaria TaxID=6596 RepID=UPI00234E6D29|nr:zinc finger C2HC domain-containing protein 1A-like isoform X2 [Mercenaria mercenaria]
MEGPPRVKLDLKPCKKCGRTFNPESLVKHERVCNPNKKVKVFDMAKQRVTEDLSLKQIKAAQRKNVQAPKSHWRQKHEEFVRNVRAARGAQKAIDEGLPLPPPPPPSENPDYIQCPYCNRRFNEKAAQRHIDFCKEQKKRLPANKRVPTEIEQKRAAATKYQPPKPKGRGSPADSPAAGGGYGASRGGYSSGPAPRGAPAGARGTPPGARGTPPGAMGSKSDAGMGRTAGGYSSGSQGYSAGSQGSSSRGRAPAPAGGVKSRQPPASQGTYANKYADPSSGQNGIMNDPLRVLSGRSLKLREDRRPASRDKPSNQNNVLSANRGAMDGNHMMSAHKSSSSSGHNFRGTDSGYHSSNSENDAAVPRLRKTGRPSSGIAKFCHECGTKYPSAQAKFCMECGIRKLEVPAR